MSGFPFLGALERRVRAIPNPRQPASPASGPLSGVGQSGTESSAVAQYPYNGSNAGATVRRAGHPARRTPPAGAARSRTLRAAARPLLTPGTRLPPAAQPASLRPGCRLLWPGRGRARAWIPGSRGSPPRPASRGRGQRLPWPHAGRKPRLSTTTSLPRRNPNR